VAAGPFPFPRPELLEGVVVFDKLTASIESAAVKTTVLGAVTCVFGHIPSASRCLDEEKEGARRAINASAH